MDRSQLEKLFDMSGRVAIVTGATRGIGRAIAEGLAAVGAKIVVASRKADDCAETARHLEAMGTEAIGVPAHMGDLEDVARLARTAGERFGHIDVVVNNAANGLYQPLGGYTPEGWQKSLDVNLRGPVFLVQEALPWMKESGHGSVINVLSSGLFRYSNAQSIYIAGKAALYSLTQSMAAEYARYSIRVNALAPGATKTDLLSGADPSVISALAKETLLRRIASPDEMVGPALLLASDAGSYITGHLILADGGLTLH
jgi:NAD(P)-dependent dehydrogenase (short-subunit alcohol dehydrogenase family)